MVDTRDRVELLARLRDDIASCGRPGRPEGIFITTGVPALDRALPGGGIRRGAVVELCGCGAETIAAVVTRAACRSPGVAVIVDRAGEFYPPALAAWDVPVARMVLVRPEGDADALWAADQALRSPAAAAVWLWRDRLLPHDGRRLQLSAAEGGGVGLLLRQRTSGFNPEAHRPSAADVQLTVTPRPGHRLRIEVTRCRAGVPGAVAEIELESGREASAVPAVAALAGPAAVG
jgi:protein ImuA